MLVREEVVFFWHVFGTYFRRQLPKELSLQLLAKTTPITEQSHPSDFRLRIRRGDNSANLRVVIF